MQKFSLLFFCIVITPSKIKVYKKFVVVYGVETGSLGQIYGFYGLYFVEFVCPLYTENSFKEKIRKLVSPNSSLSCTGSASNLVDC